jgi:hypothetical protein
MELRIFTEPQQGASYEDILGIALAAEEDGFGAFFRSDHYMKMGDVSGLPGATDAWSAPRPSATPACSLSPSPKSTP